MYGIRRKRSRTGESTALPLRRPSRRLPKHPERAVLIGMSGRARILFTVFLERGDSETRLISARRATRAERRRYEEGE